LEWVTGINMSAASGYEWSASRPGRFTRGDSGPGNAPQARFADLSAPIHNLGNIVNYFLCVRFKYYYMILQSVA
jgi:hypothetical protein